MFKASTVALLVAGSMICLCAAAAQEKASDKASEPKKASPYADANKRHIDPVTGRHQQTMKRAAAGRVQGSPTRRKH